MKITEEQAEILDYIVLESLKTVCLRAYDLKSLENGFLSNHEDVKESAYTYYFDILKEKNVVRVEKGLNNKTEIYSIDIKTKEFLRQGGFKKEIQDEFKRIEEFSEKEKLEIELAKSNLEANELNKSIAAKNEKDKKQNKTERIINISLGVLNLVLLVVQILISLYKD